MAKSLLLVFTNYTDDEVAFNRWYDEQHIHDILKVPGVVAAQRYGLAPISVPESEDVTNLPPAQHRYLTVYEIEGQPDNVMREFAARANTDLMPLSPTLDLQSVYLNAWTPQGARVDAQNIDEFRRES